MPDFLKIKQQKELVLNLKKDSGIEGVQANTVAVIDRSGSMDWLYDNGMVQRTLDRLLPFGLAFDSNQEVDVYAFHDNYKALSAPLTIKNLSSYVEKEFNPLSYGGTAYAPVIKAITSKYGKTSGGLLGLGSKPVTADIPTYVLFLTDGDNGDHDQTERAIIEASRHGIFFQFVGIGRTSFNFLKKLDDLEGRVIDNANFFQVNDLDSVSDNELYSRLITEFPSWLKLSKAAGQIR